MTTADGSVIGKTQIFGSAPASHAFNVVLLAEGFTTAQQAHFNTACMSFVQAFLTTPPLTGSLQPSTSSGSTSARQTPAPTTRPRPEEPAPRRGPISTPPLAPTEFNGSWSVTT